MPDNQIRDIVFLDTETLGLHPDAPIWEFAAIRRDCTKGTEYTTAITIQHDPEQWLEDIPDQFLDDYGSRYIAEEAYCERAAVSAIDAATTDAIVSATPMADQKIFAFWRIAFNRHTDGISAVFGGSVHTYEARIVHAVQYWKGFDEGIVSAINLELTKRERNNW